MSEDEEMTYEGFNVAEAQELVALARSLTDEDRTLDPVPDDLWDEISAAIRAEAGVPPTPLRSAHRFLPVLSVAAVALVVLGAVGIFAFRAGDARDTVATSILDPFAAGYDGDASLVQTGDGYELELELSELPEVDGYYELWLIKSLDTGEMQSLGFIDGSGSVDLPPGLDPDEYATVDISIEPLDGVPTHSGNSVLRGTLGT